MRWHDLLFMHWPIDAAVLQGKVPAGLEIDTFGGCAWIAVVPFRMTNVRPRPLPPLPWLSAFPELNVRTYVTRGGKPGVWFLSLDAANAIAVRVARARFHLPYIHARMSSRERDGWIDYSSERHAAGSAESATGRYHGRYRPIGPASFAPMASLERFLTARYCLYAQSRDGRLFRGEIDHEPWPLQFAQAEVTENTMLAAHGIKTPATPPLLHFARRLDVVAWSLEPA
jgi:uncharacterized protein YqjF (DUF2071 family)